MPSCPAESSRSNVSRISDELVARAGSALARAAWAELGGGASFKDLEAKLHELANEAVRRELALRLQRMADQHTERVQIEGKLYRRHEPGEVEYHTLCGKIRVRRWTYREVGVRNGPTLVALDLAAGLVRQATPALAYSIAVGYAAGPMRHYEAQMRSAHRLPPPRATLERLAGYVGGCAAQDVMKIEARLRSDEIMPDAGHAIAVSLDRTSVAMAEERPPGVPPNSRRRARSKPYVRKPPDPIDVNWRMIYVGTVSLVDATGETIVTRKYHATPEEGAGEITTRMMADVVRWRAQKPLPVIVVQDGAPEMWNQLRPALRLAGIGKWTELIDRYHLNERLSQVAEMLEPSKSSAGKRFARWQQQLDEKDSAIRNICGWIRKRMPVAGAAAELIRSHHYYMDSYGRMMRYASARRAGLPIASGCVEGACKSLVAMRAKRSGQRWRQDGLTAALTLRALEQSDRLQPFWRYFEVRFSAEISVAA